jgi:hypothetical protein
MIKSVSMVSGNGIATQGRASERRCITRKTRAKVPELAALSGRLPTSPSLLASAILDGDANIDALLLTD